MERQTNKSQLRPELIDEFRKVYADRRSAIHEHVKKVKQILEDAMKSGMFRAIPITTRMKEFNSALGSLQRRQIARLERQELRNRMREQDVDWEQYWKRRGKERRVNDWGPFENTEDMVNALHDFGGARVCVYFPDDVEKVVCFLRQCELIKIVQITRKTQGPTDIDDLRKYVEMLEQHSPQSSQDHSRAEAEPVVAEKLFAGYRATHVVVELVGDAVPEWHTGSHYRVEVQIGTVVMHAWSQIEHDIIYKPGGNEPSDEEKGVLDLFNGIVIAGEAALKQLAACTARKEKERSKVSNVPASNHYELGVWLAAYCDEHSLCPHRLEAGPAWHELDKLLDILRSSDDHTSGKLRDLLDKVRETSGPGFGAFGNDLPLHLLKAKFELATDATPRFSSEAVPDRRQKTLSEARHLAFRVVHSINMASYLGFMDRFVKSIEMGLPNRTELARPSLIDFLDLLHPKYPRLDRDTEDNIIVFCETFLDVDNLKRVIKDETTLLKMQLPLLLTDIGCVVCPTSSSWPSDDEVCTVVPRSLSRVLDDPERIHRIPEILDHAVFTSHFSPDTKFQTLYRRVRSQSLDRTASPWQVAMNLRDIVLSNQHQSPSSNEYLLSDYAAMFWLDHLLLAEIREVGNHDVKSPWGLVAQYAQATGNNHAAVPDWRVSTERSQGPDYKKWLSRMWESQTGYFEPTPDEPTWRYVRVHPNRWTVNKIDLSRLIPKCKIEKLTRTSQWVDFVNCLKPDSRARLVDEDIDGSNKYSFKIGKCGYTFTDLGDTFNFLLEHKCRGWHSPEDESSFSGAGTDNADINTSDDSNGRRTASEKTTKDERTQNGVKRPCKAVQIQRKRARLHPPTGS
ncbi:hypothetical protein F5Y04DRAFT_96503 [Hypomontagnella monticulosa]|nr:hypothetical protein F5Y04DRAFT_96503 [Hypomontagnella monticulosa]